MSAFSRHLFRTGHRPRVSRRPGVALVIILIFVALLSLIVAGLMDTLGKRLVEGERAAQRGSLRTDAESAVEVMRARLSRYAMDSSGIRINAADLALIAADPLDGWTPPDGATVSVKLRDESGLYSINITDTVALQNLFRDMGVSESRAAGLADSLADWIDADDRRRTEGAESSDYSTPGFPANRPLKSFAELRHVRGFAEVFFNDDGSPNDLGKELESVVTFLDAGPYPNINGAPDAVLAVLASRTGLDTGGVVAKRATLNYPDDRAHPGLFNNAGDLTAINADTDIVSRLSFAARTIRVIVTASKGELRYRLDVLLTPSGTNGGAPVVVSKRVDESLLCDEGSGYAEGSSDPALLAGAS